MDAANTKKKVHLKMVIIGAAGVGKTTFIHRYLDKQFQESISTLGASFSLKQWGSYNIAIWDTAGEEKFRGLSNFYCRGAGAAIVAFDLTNEDSFHALRAIFLPLLESALPDCIKVVVGTKRDLVAKEGRAVSLEDGMTLARDINSPGIVTNEQTLYFETSSLTGINVEEAVETLFKLCTPAMRLKFVQEGGDVRTVDDGPPKSAKTGGCAC